MAIDEIRDLDLDSGVERTNAEEIPFQSNENDDLASYFAQPNTHLDSMNAQMLSYGEQIRVLGDRMNTFEYWLI